jgi:hypothetical protein
MKTVTVIALALLATPAFATPNLYDRVDQKIAATPAIRASLGMPAPQMRDVDWMVGKWEIVAQADGTDPAKPADKGSSTVTKTLGGVWLEIRDNYPNGTTDIGYLTYNVATGQWVSLSFDALANATRTVATGWNNGRASFEGDAVIVGVPARLQQVIERVSDGEYRVTNQEWRDGGWQKLDSYRYRRVSR